MRKTITIGELGTVITGKTPPTTNKNYYGDYAVFIKPTDISEQSKYTYETEEMYSKVAAEKYKSSQIPQGAICVPCIGTIGTKMTMAPCDCYTNQSINSIICNENYDNEYVYYLIKHFLPGLKSYNLGTASGREYVSKTNFEKIELVAEQDKTIQIKIGKFLSRYDSLIENYQKQIKLLEEAAQRLYKEWFVDLRFPGHENTKIVNGLPDGWEKKMIGEIAEINKRNIPKNYEYSFVNYTDLGNVRLGNMDSPIIYDYGEEPGRAKRVAIDGDIIWGMVRPNLKSYTLVQYPKEQDVFSTGFAVLTAKRVPFSFLYCHVTTEAFVGYLVNCTNGAAYPAVKPEHFSKAEIVIPSKYIMDVFNGLVEPMFRIVGNFQSQIRLLTEARDRLLQKLMSGEIEVGGDGLKGQQSVSPMATPWVKKREITNAP